MRFNAKFTLEMREIPAVKAAIVTVSPGLDITGITIHSGFSERVHMRCINWTTVAKQPAKKCNDAQNYPVWMGRPRRPSPGLKHGISECGSVMSIYENLLA